MNDERNRTKTLALAFLLAIALLFLSLAVYMAPPFVLNISETPLWRLGPLYAASTVVSIAIFAVAPNGKLKWSALAVVALSGIGILAVIEPTGRMHDSLTNGFFGMRLFLGESPLVIDPYVSAFPGAFIFLGAQLTLAGISLENLSAFYAPYTAIIYVLLFISIGKSLERLRIIPTKSSISLAFVVVVWGAIFGLRINPAPATIGLLLSFLLLSISLQKQSVAKASASLVVVAALVISHPISPILATVLLVSLGIAIVRTRKRLFRLSVTLYSSLAAWILFLGGFVFLQAIEQLRTFAVLDVGAETVPSTQSLPELGVYLMTYRLSLLLLAVLAILGLRRMSPQSRRAVFGPALVFGSAVLLTLSTLFYTRVAAFLLIPLSISLTYCSGLLSPAQVFRAKSPVKRTVEVIVIVLLVASGTAALMTSYWTDSAFDQVTSTELAAGRFLSEWAPAGTIDFGGFVPPYRFDASILPAQRGVTEIGTSQDATYLVITQQRINAAVITEGKAFLATELWSLTLWAESTMIRAFDSGESVVFVQSRF